MDKYKLKNCRIENTDIESVIIELEDMKEDLKVGDLSNLSWDWFIRITDD